MGHHEHTYHHLLFLGPDITTWSWDFVTWGLNLPLTAPAIIILFLRDVEDLLTSHPCSSMNSHLDVFVASYQNELTTCILFCKITLIQSSLAIWGCYESVEAHRKLKVVFKRTKSSRNPLPVAQKQQTASGTELWC